MAKAFGYMRKSSVKDLARDAAPLTQEREVRALAARHGDADGLTILADWDVSGSRKKTDKRTGYLALRAAIDRGEASAVYSYSLSRLGRSVQELSRLFDLCIDRGVPIRLVADAVDTSTASGRMLANILASVAQFESDVASERQHARNDTKRERGESLRTQRLYGEKAGDDVEAVMAAFREAGTFAGAARLLNAQGVRARSSERGWWASSVAVVVSRLDPQVGARRPTRGARAGRSAFTLARLLKCPTCGSMLTGSSLPRSRRPGMPSSGDRVTRYACRFAESMPHPRVAVSEHLILPLVDAEAARWIERPDEGDAVDAAARRADLEARRRRLEEGWLAGILTDKADVRRQTAEIDAELNRMSAAGEIQTIDFSKIDENATLRDIFDEIHLDPKTFRPVGFTWRDPARRRANDPHADWLRSSALGETSSTYRDWLDARGLLGARAGAVSA